MKNKKKINYKVLTIIIVAAVVITAVLSFLFIKNKNVIIKQGEKEGELLQASYSDTIYASLFGTNTPISYEANEYYNYTEDNNNSYWQYYSFKIGNKKFNYTWLGGKCFYSCNRATYGSYCKNLTSSNFKFNSFSSNGYKYIVVYSTPVRVITSSLQERPPYTATVFLETGSEYQMVFEVPTPRYVQFNLSTSTYGSYGSSYNFSVDTSSGYLQYLAMSTTSGKVDVHRVYFNGSNVSDTVVGQESGSIKMS